MKTSVENESRGKEQELKRMKRNALFLFGVVVFFFVIAVYYKIDWLKAFTEAAMVGGIADWFAVVALFRHPLGIPIPHTALIPNRKDKIGVNLGNFISDEFLTREKLEVKLEEFNVAQIASDWLMDSKNANTVANVIAEDLIPSILETIDDDDVKHFIRSQFNERIGKINFGEWIAIGLESLSKSEKQEQLISNILEKLKSELEKNQEQIEDKVKKSTPWLTFGMLDKKLAAAIYQGFLEFIEEASHKDSSVRKRINEELHNYITQLKESPEMQKNVNDLVFGVINNKEVQDYVSGIWQEIKEAIANDLAKKEDSTIKRKIAIMIQSFAGSIKEDDKMKAKINDFIKNDILSIVINNKKFIGDLISTTVKNWEAKEVSEKLELEIGSDLQYIRISGTLVGGFVGLVIFAIVSLIHSLMS